MAVGRQHAEFSKTPGFVLGLGNVHAIPSELVVQRVGIINIGLDNERVVLALRYRDDAGAMANPEFEAASLEKGPTTRPQDFREPHLVPVERS